MRILAKRYTCLVLAIMLSMLSTGVTVATADAGAIQGYSQSVGTVVPPNFSLGEGVEPPAVPQFSVFGYSPSGSAEDFTGNFTSVKAEVHNGTDWVEYTTGVLAKNSTLRIVLDYKIAVDLSLNVNHTFKLPADFVSLYKELGGSMSIEVKNGNVKAATVTLNSSGDCTINFENEALAHKDTTGSFFLAFDLKEDKLNNQLLTFNFFPDTGAALLLKLDLALSQIVGEVTATHNPTIDTSNSRIKWVVDVTPKLKNADANVLGASGLTNFTVSSKLDATLTGIVADTDPSIAKNGVAIDGATFTLVDGTLTCTLPDEAWSSGDKYTMTYYTSYDLGAFVSDDSKDFTNVAAASFDYPQYAADSSTGSPALSGSSKTATVSNKTAKATVAVTLLSKEQSHNPANHTITWTVTVNGDAVTFGNAITLTDILPPGLSLTGVTVDGIPATVGTGSGNYKFTPDPEYPANPYGGGTLVVNGLSGDAAHTVVYTTTIDPAIWKKQDKATFVNSVSFKGGVNTFTRSKSATYNFGGASGGLIGADGTYDTTNHTFTWNVHVNTYKTSIANGVVTVTIPDGLTYVSHSTDIGTDVVSGNAITVTLPTSTSDTGIITLTTTVDGVSIWATNLATPKEYSITAELADMADDIYLKAEPKVNATSKVIEKSSTGYDYASKEITWRIDFDQNKMAMTAPVITDKLPDGLEYVTGSATATGATLTTGSVVSYDKANENTLTLSFDNIVAGASSVSRDTYVTFKTKVVDETLLTHPDATNAGPEITNSASIGFTELGSETAPSSAHSRRVGSRPLAKSGDATSGNNPAYRIISWTVEINPNQIAMTAPKLEDNLAEGLVLDKSSVKLHNATVASDGKLTAVGTAVDPSKYTVTLDKQKFTFAFAEDINSAYILTFDTDNLNPIKTDYYNGISFAGNTNSTASSGKVTQATASGGSTNPNRGSVKLTAYLKDGRTPLAGVSYTITRPSTSLTQTIVTGSDGIAWFNPLQYDTYTITESVTGYTRLTPADLPSFTLSSGSLEARHQVAKLTYKLDTDEDYGSVKLTAQLEGSTTLLAGVKYTISGKSTGFTQSIVTGTDGIAWFNPLQYDTYTITESVTGYTRLTPADLPSFTLSSGSLEARHQVAKLTYKPKGSSSGGSDSSGSSSDSSGSSSGGGSSGGGSSGGGSSGGGSSGGGSSGGGSSGGGSSGDSGSSSSITSSPSSVPPPNWSSKPTVDIDSIVKPVLPRGQGGMIFSAATVGSKSATGSSKAVAGVGFELDVNGKKITLTTDKNGVIVLPDLPSGSYTVRVTSVPAGYTFDQSQSYTAHVTANSWVMAEVMLFPLYGNPNTGDISRLGMALAIAAMSITLAALALRYPARRS